MRITCPNCEAQYEVDDALIPENGRDVQCSNCGKGWFQTRSVEPEEAPGPAGDAERNAQHADPVPEPETQTHGDETAPAVIGEEAGQDPGARTPEATERHETPGDSAADTPEEAAEDDDDDDVGGDTPSPATKAPPGTDASVLSVLREEAERELARRREDAAGLESQPDLGLAEAPGRRPPPVSPDAAEVGGTGRRDLLPDIDAINSTLRSDAERPETLQSDDGDIVEERRRGFRLGFGLMLLIAGALIGLYVGAEAISAAVPALAPAVAAYVEMANGFRAWIDGLLAAGVEGLSSLLPPAADA
jgi:predicted Zn finger-like uncharacterized protein